MHSFSETKDLLMEDNIQELIRITPETEKLYCQFIQSIPSAQLQVGSGSSFLMSDDFGTEESFEKLILNMSSQILDESNNNNNNNNKNVFLTQPVVDEEQLRPLVQQEHDYSAAKKRKVSYASLDESLTNDSFSSSMTDNSTSLSKRNSKSQRPRGIYRYDDVTNDEELQNYLERRKKNNISSKVSRANKKKAYDQMDYRFDELEKSNERLRKKIVEAEKINKIIKDLLVEKVTQNKK